MGRPCINRGRSATKQSDEEQDYSKWDPVKWFSQRGYNVTQMIHAPGMKIEKNRSIVWTKVSSTLQFSEFNISYSPYQRLLRNVEEKLDNFSQK